VAKQNEKGKRQQAGPDARLAAALRENLRRRKAQARGRGSKPPEASDADKAPGKRDQTD